METYLDATTLIALGSVGELQLFADLDGPLVTTPRIVDGVTTEPAQFRVEQILDDGPDDRSGAEGDHSNEEIRIRLQREMVDQYVTRASELLGDEERNGDVELVASVLRARERDRDVGVISDDRRVRTVTDELGATVTGTLGVVVRAVREGMAADEAKSLVRELDSEGLHLTGELRDTAFGPIDEAAEEARKQNPTG